MVGTQTSMTIDPLPKEKGRTTMITHMGSLLETIPTPKSMSDRPLPLLALPLLVLRLLLQLGDLKHLIMHMEPLRGNHMMIKIMRNPLVKADMRGTSPLRNITEVHHQHPSPERLIGTMNPILQRGNENGLKS